MSNYLSITLTDNQFNRIIDNLMTYTSNLDNYYEIEEVVHLIDYLYDEYHNCLEENKKKLRNELL